MKDQCETNNLILALFERPHEAQAVREDLLNAGLGAENVSVISEIPLNEKAGGPGRSLLSCFADEAGDEPRSCVIVYDEPEQVRTAARIIERHHPRDVKKCADAA